MGRSFHLAVAQSPAELDGAQARLEWLAGILPDVATQGTDLLLLPELFAIGYNIGDLVTERAEPANGPLAQAMKSLAQAHGVALHYGYAEREGNKIYNSAQCFDPDGACLGGHRKLLLPPGFERDHFVGGSQCQLFAFRDVRIATLICYDIEFAETARHVAALGAELILVPTALGAQWGWVAQRMIPTRAYENGVFLAYANSAGAENGMSYLGQSFIAAPDGQELVRAKDASVVIHAQLNLDKVAAAQARLPYLQDCGRLFE